MINYQPINIRSAINQSESTFINIISLAAILFSHKIYYSDLILLYVQLLNKCKDNEGFHFLNNGWDFSHVVNHCSKHKCQL